MAWPSLSKHVAVLPLSRPAFASILGPMQIAAITLPLLYVSLARFKATSFS